MGDSPKKHRGSIPPSLPTTTAIDRCSDRVRGRSSLVDRVEFLTDDRSNPFSERVLPTVDIQVRSQERSAFVEGVAVGLYAPRALLSGGTARILPACRDRSRSQDADRFAAAIALTASSYQGGRSTVVEPIALDRIVWTTLTCWPSAAASGNRSRSTRITPVASTIAVPLLAARSVSFAVCTVSSSGTNGSAAGSVISIR